MTADDMAIWPYIFSGAYVVDLDFSAWQRSVVLYLNADHASEMRYYRPAIFHVEFLQVRQWNVALNHLDSEREADTQPPEHFNWNIRRYDAQPLKRGVELTFWGDSEHPRVVIACERVTIHEVPGYVLDQAVPQWQEAGLRFIRPSIEQMARELDS